MKAIKQLILLAAFMLISAVGFSQVTGTVVEGDTGTPLPGASVMVKGTKNGTSTDFDGKFNISASEAGVLVITYVGFTTMEVPFSSTSQDLGTINLEANAEVLEGVVVTGVTDIAKDRETPVAVSTIKAAQIQERLGNQEFPEVLRSTPSVYVTKQGGGFGDSRINIRGFDQSNIAVLINGMPVNDMENGAVYWSNWAGLSDVTSAMQVQRGLGSSKLAISSVGGTINVLTRSADQHKGGKVSGAVGNDGYLKTTASYNTGIMENGLSVSALFGRTAGDGYVDGTSYEGYNYFLAIGYKASDKHDFQFTITGAPQNHNQRGNAPTLGTYINYGDGSDPNIKYNADYGYRNGKEFTFSGNFYHKPIASLNWDWKISESSKLSSVFYASFGRGGSIGSIGRINDGRSYYNQFKDANGLVRVDDIVAWNQGVNVPDFGDQRTGYTGGGNPAYQGMYINGGDYDSPYVDDYNHIRRSTENGISQRSSVNSHNWLGAVINFNNEINENWKWDVGADVRYYKGIHYRRLVDLLGADAYVDNDNINNPYNFTTATYAPTIGNTWNVFKSTDKETKIDYYNDGKVNWIGGFGQLEYTDGVISAFVQGAISNQGFQRIDYFNYLDSDPDQESDWENFLGGNIKGGINYNINEKNNVFFNTGYYSRQPKFDGVFIDYNSNAVNEDARNEKVFGLELGYGFRSKYFNANVNLYRTTWKDRYETVSAYFDIDNTPDNSNDDVQGSANVQGIEEVHMGVEVDFVAKPLPSLSINGMVSIGDWEYGGNVTGRAYDGNTYIGDIPLYLDGVKVGDAAQFTSRLGVTYRPVNGLSIYSNWDHMANLYAQIDATSFDTPDNQGSLELPAYDLFDGGASYRFDLKEGLGFNGISIGFNVNNIFDKTYISESWDNIHASEGDDTWEGISTSNRVYFGWGRSWNATLSLTF